MDNKKMDILLEDASQELSNFIYLYGGTGYFTNIDDDKFKIEIYDLKCFEIDNMIQSEAEKHLLKKMSVDISELLQDEKCQGYRIAWKIMEELKTATKS